MFCFWFTSWSNSEKLIDRISCEKNNNGKTVNAVGQTKLMVPCVCQRRKKNKQKVTRKAHGLSCYISLCSAWTCDFCCNCMFLLPLWKIHFQMNLLQIRFIFSFAWFADLEIVYFVLWFTVIAVATFFFDSYELT